jgi:serine/threonine protein kinase
VTESPDRVAGLFETLGTDAPEALRSRARDLATNWVAKTENLPLAPGDHAGPYEIEGIVGSGGQAVVYSAIHRALGRRVALKFPRREVGDRIVREARLLAKLAHPSIVQVIDLSVEGPVPYLVLEFCDSWSLEERLEAVSPDGLPLEQVRAVATAVLEALAFAHENGVIHRDVKPANILFDSQNRAKVSDFGIGTIARADDLSHSADLSQLSLLAGTPLYIAPEQENPALRLDGRLDGRADLFSFGKVLFQMLTGASPRTLRPASRLRKGLDPAWDEYVFKLTEERPEYRFTTARTALAALPPLRAPRSVKPSVSGGIDPFAGADPFGPDPFSPDPFGAGRREGAPPPAIPAPAAPRLPERIGDCRVLSRSSDEGFVEVFHAHHERLDRAVLVRLVRPEAASPRVIERLLRDARSAQAIDHPNVARTLEVGKTAEGRAFVVTEEVEGKPLHELAGSGKPRPWRDALGLVRSVARGLAAAHRGVVHRDLRPDNILVGPAGVVKVAGFGLATDMDTATNLTSCGAVVGSPFYMAPEAVMGKALDGRADIYSLGVVFYELLTGVQPFEADSAVEVFRAKVEGKIAPPEKHVAGIPDPVRRVLGRMLETDRDRRYATAVALLEDLDALERGSPVKAGEPTLWRKPGLGIELSLAVKAARLLASAPALWTLSFVVFYVLTLVGNAQLAGEPPVARGTPPCLVPAGIAFVVNWALLLPLELATLLGFDRRFPSVASGGKATSGERLVGLLPVAFLMVSFLASLFWGVDFFTVKPGVPRVESTTARLALELLAIYSGALSAIVAGALWKLHSRNAGNGRD